MYRRNVPMDTHDENQRNAADEPQFQGVVFDDGRVAVRWLTAKRSVSVWDNLDDMLAIHGHPEYDSELVWHDALFVQRSEATWDGTITIENDCIINGVPMKAGIYKRHDEVSSE